jgi:hypothetical protein
MVTKNERGCEENSSSDSDWHCGDRGLFAIGTCCFSVKLISSVSGCYSFINRYCLDEKGKRGQNVSFSYNCANSIGAVN